MKGHFTITLLNCIIVPTFILNVKPNVEGKCTVCMKNETQVINILNIFLFALAIYYSDNISVLSHLLTGYIRPEGEKLQ